MCLGACGGTPPAPEATSLEPVPRAAPADVGIAEVRTGIALCDSYVRAMNECLLPTLGAEEQERRLGAMKQSLAGWREQTNTTVPSGEIEKSCRKALAVDEGELRSKGCLK